VPAGVNVADNFWRPGNILCALDPAGGTVRRAVRGQGSTLEEIEAHPDSGARILGFALPCWREVVSLTLDAARSFAPLRFHKGWDVAVCPDGPLLVELNAGSEFGLPQIATGQGLADETFARSWRNEAGQPIADERPSLPVPPQAAPAPRCSQAVRPRHRAGYGTGSGRSRANAAGTWSSRSTTPSAPSSRAGTPV
jgi:Sugar-transfer associated ATP-grasp